MRPGDVVVDASCGLGTYAVLACRAGASRVYAIDSTPILEAARAVVRHDGCADHVTFIAEHTRTLEPREPAQVVIFEHCQAGLFVPATLADVRDLATRWLAPGGSLLPARARLFVVPGTDEAGHRTANDALASLHGLDQLTTLSGDLSMEVELRAKVGTPTTVTTTDNDGTGTCP